MTKYSKSRGARLIEYIRIFRILRLSRTDVDSNFSLLCRHLLDFSNGTWPTFDQLHRKYGGPPRINLAPLDFKYSVIFQVSTFFLWRLYCCFLSLILVPFFHKQGYITHRDMCLIKGTIFTSVGISFRVET